MNTLVRRPDGSLAGYNTDWDAAISAIENSLTSDGEILWKLSTALEQSCCSVFGGVTVHCFRADSELIQRFLWEERSLQLLRL